MKRFNWAFGCVVMWMALTASVVASVRGDFQAAALFWVIAGLALILRKLDEIGDRR